MYVTGPEDEDDQEATESAVAGRGGLETHTFEEVDGGTKVTQHAVFQSVADRDGMKDSGTEQHAPVAMAQLQDVAGSL